MHQMRPMSASSYQHRFNLDGYVTHDTHVSPVIGAPTSSYTQLFRAGAFEVFDERILINLPGTNKTIPTNKFEEEVISVTDRLLSLQKTLGIVPPIAVLVTLVGVKDFRIAVSAHNASPTTIDREILLLPEVLVQEYPIGDDEVASTMRPIFDSLWQAAGLDGSRNYNASGAREARR
jgi:hypothetical protein